MCQFTPAERAEGRKALEQLTHKDLVAAVATPPDQWQITIEERVELVEYLANRQQALLTGELVREEGGSDGQ